MPQNDRLSRITKLLNKNFYSMKFEDKKKVLGLIVSEQECDEVLIRFLARQYDVDFDQEKEKLLDTTEKHGQVYRKSVHNGDDDDDLEDIDSPEPTPDIISSPKRTPAPAKTLVKTVRKTPTPAPAKTARKTPTPAPTRTARKTPLPEPEESEEDEVEEEEAEEESEEEEAEEESEAEEEEEESEAEEEEESEEEEVEYIYVDEDEVGSDDEVEYVDE